MSRRNLLGLLTATVIAAGCSKGHPSDGDDEETPDAGDPGEIDAEPHLDPPDADPNQPDAPPGTPDANTTPDATIPPQAVTLAQTTDTTTVVTENSAACANTYGVTRENSYYRAFTLAEHGVTGALTINQVSIGVETAIDDPPSGSPAATQPGTVRIHTYTGTVGTTLNLAQATLIAEQGVTIPNNSTNTVLNFTVNATVPAASTFLVEFLIPDGDPDGDTFGPHFYIGSNTSNETKPSYIRAPACSITAPSQVGTIGFAGMHTVINVYGTYQP
jgi:hypothetical protein